MNSRDSINKVLETPTRIVISTGIAFLVGYYLYQYQKKVYQDCPEALSKVGEPKVMRVHSILLV